MSRRVAFLTMEDPEGFFTYDHLAVEPLRRLGWDVTEIPWDRRDAAWQEYAAAVIRSPWDYQQRPQAFVRVLETIEWSGARLWNSVEVVRWNIHKSYLQDLQQRGVRVVPSRWLPALPAAELAASFDALQTDEIVAKPMVGANADDTFRVPRHAGKSTREAVAACFANRECLVQPFLPSIVEIGEYSLFYFDREYSHAILKTPAAGDFRVQEEHGGIIQTANPSRELRDAADRALSDLPFRTLYARIDLVHAIRRHPRRDGSGIDRTVFVFWP